MNNTPLVSIIIPTYNRKKMVGNLVRSLLKGLYSNIEIIVIDDASSDNTSEYLKLRFGKNKKVNIYKNKKNLFAAGSKNVGQQKASGEFYAFIDDDNLADKNMINELVGFMNKNPNAGEVGPINYFMGRQEKVLLSRSTRNMWTTKTLHLRSLSPFKGLDYWETDDIPNAFMVRADLVKKQNIRFRSGFGIMYEESDYAYQIRNKGYKIYFVKNAKIYHDVDSKDRDFVCHFLQDTRRSYIFARNRLIFHSFYSSKLQNIGIILFWIWFFTIYYIYKFISYKGVEDFSFYRKLTISSNYLKGDLRGLVFVLSKENFD